MTILRAEFVGRTNFGQWLVAKGLVGNAVEVGTHRGEFAYHLLKQWPGVLTCVDPWQYGYDPTDPASQGDRKADYLETVTRLAQFAPRVNYVLLCSLEAAKTIAPNSLDFVYIDACHQYNSVVSDLLTWWPLVKPGGVIAGHDIVCPDWGHTVQPAVLRFAELVKRDVHLVTEQVVGDPDHPWSYYLIK